MSRPPGFCGQYGYRLGQTPPVHQCEYCLEDAEWSMELGQREWAQVYEDSAYNEDCIHMPQNRHELADLEQGLPRELRFQAVRPRSGGGTRPRGPSHLTLPHYVLCADDHAHRNPHTNLASPSWPAYRDRSESAEGSRRGTSHHDHHGTSYRGPSSSGSSQHGTSRYESSHNHGSSSSGMGMPAHSGRPNYNHDAPQYPTSRHTSERWGGSDDESDGDRDDLSSSSSVPWTRSQRPDMGERRGSGSW